MREPERKLLTEAEIRADFFLGDPCLLCGPSEGSSSFIGPNTEAEQLPTDSLQELAGVLRRSSGDDERALERIIELTYPDLRRIAHRCRGREPPLHTFQAKGDV